MLNAVWFRADLRVRDNPALYESMTRGGTIAVYCLTPDQWEKHSVSPAKRAFIVSHLTSLQKQLALLNVPFTLLKCSEFSSVPRILSAWLCKYHVGRLYFNHEFELNERRLTQQIISEMTKSDIRVHSYVDQCAIAPGQLKTQNNEFYKVFTPFRRAYVSKFNRLARPLAPLPKKQRLLSSDLPFACDLSLASDLSELDTIKNNFVAHLPWLVGEDAALQQLNNFMTTRVNDYHDHRDKPALDGTSSLSPYLAVGALSTRQCLASALSSTDGDINHDIDGEIDSEIEVKNQGTNAWVTEIIWREFYRHTLYALPQLCRHEPFKVDTDLLPWSHDITMFSRWQQGQTGFPLVDAAMRQLSTTSWMHNRLRMVTAMFLTKHLFIDWRWGERHFMANLIDGDFASNNGGWQWSASTGVDAAPYFRVFNPVRQSQRFDSNGDFIRQFIPELAELDNKSIHCPSPTQAAALGYPLPIVDHAKAVQRTKDLFKRLPGLCAIKAIRKDQIETHNYELQV